MSDLAAVPHFCKEGGDFVKRFAFLLLMLLLVVSFSFACAEGEDSDVQVGEIVAFGRYKQSFNPLRDAEPIEWVVLDAYPEDGICLVITRYAISARAFHTEENYPTWENSSIRAWLNSDFLTAAFTEEERQAILPVKVITFDYKACDGGADTIDSIFLLSNGEVAVFMREKELRMATPTKTAAAAGLSLDERSGMCEWWLRDPGFAAHVGSYVDDNGSASRFVGRGCDTILGIRPAMWVSIDSLTILSE